MSVTGDLTEAPPSRLRSGGWWRARRHVLGVVILGLWLLWIASAWWVAPQHVSTGDLTRALSAHEVSSWERQSTPPKGLLASTGFGPGTSRASSSDSSSYSDDGTIVVWRDFSGRQYWTDAIGLPAISAPGASSYGQALDQWLDRQAQPGHFAPAINYPQLFGLAFWGLGMFSVIFGFTPRMGNRWFWFWIGGLTLGLGLVWYAVAECLREPAPRNRRLGGGVGFFWAIGLALVVSLAAVLLTGFVERL